MDKTAYEGLVKQLYRLSAKKPAMLRVPPLQFANAVKRKALCRDMRTRSVRHAYIQ